MSWLRIRRMVITASIGWALTASPIQAGLIGWWKLDDGTGNTAADASPSGTTGQIANADTGGLGPGGSVWVDDAERGTVISFNGEASGAYVRAGDIPQMTLDTDFTWAFWGNQDAGNTTPNDVIIGNRHNADGQDFTPRQFIKFTPTKFEWHMNGNGNDNLDYEDIPSGQWLHHAVVKDGDQLTYFRNGVEAGTQTITQGLDFPQPFFMGGENTNSAGENWRGMLSDVRLYDQALSGAEVAALVPEPACSLLALLGIAGIAATGRRRRSTPTAG